MFKNMVVNGLHCGIKQKRGLIAHTLTIHTHDLLLSTVRQGSGVQYCAYVQQRCRTGFCGASVLHLTHVLASIMILRICAASFPGWLEIMQCSHEMLTFDTC